MSVWLRILLPLWFSDRTLLELLWSGKRKMPLRECWARGCANFWFTLEKLCSETPFLPLVDGSIKHYERPNRILDPFQERTAKELKALVRCLCLTTDHELTAPNLWCLGVARRCVHLSKVAKTECMGGRNGVPTGGSEHSACVHHQPRFHESEGGGQG